MRQLRVQSRLCSDQRIVTKCQDDYSFSNEEKERFDFERTYEEYSLSIQKTFQYQIDKNNFIHVGKHGTYNTGGYIYEFRGSRADLRSNISQLHKLRWIDEKTRAILIQMTLYNPNMQLFIPVRFLTEFLSTGGIHSQIRIEPMDFLTFNSLFQLVCIILYMLIIFYFMWIEIQSLFKFKWTYFTQFWSYVELGIIICSWTSLGVYIWRYKESERISQLFKQTNRYFYINLQFAAYVNDLLTFLFGFCCFFGTIKFYRLCRFNQRLTLFSQTLKHAAKDLGHFSLIFFSFICLFYLLFVSKIRSCSSFSQTAQMLSEMTLSKFDANELLNAEAILGPLCFSLFVIFIIFICLGMFISIINDSFQSVRKKKRDDDDDVEIYSYMLKKFLRWSHLKQPTKTELAEEQDQLMRSEYVHKIDHLMNKVDRITAVQKN